MSPLSVEVRFLGHRTGTDERGASYTLFHISVVADGLAWEVERRFSEFKKLAETLKQQAIAQSGQKDLPALPPALPSAILNPGFMTSSLNKEFVERRAAGLQEYLQALTRHASTDLGQLVEFLSASTDAPAEPWSPSEPGSVHSTRPSERGVDGEGVCPDTVPAVDGGTLRTPDPRTPARSWLEPLPALAWDLLWEEGVEEDGGDALGVVAGEGGAQEEGEEGAGGLGGPGLCGPAPGLASPRQRRAQSAPSPHTVGAAGGGTGSAGSAGGGGSGGGEGGGGGGGGGGCGTPQHQAHRVAAEASSSPRSAEADSPTPRIPVGARVWAHGAAGGAAGEEGRGDAAGAAGRLLGRRVRGGVAQCKVSFDGYDSP